MGIPDEIQCQTKPGDFVHLALGKHLQGIGYGSRTAPVWGGAGMSPCLAAGATCQGKQKTRVSQNVSSQSNRTLGRYCCGDYGHETSCFII